MDHPIEIYLERGDKKVFACAIDWPGWCRSGRDEASAIQALASYAPRYLKIIRAIDQAFPSPQNAGDFSVVERLEGSMATSFGVPEKILAQDFNPLGREEIEKFTGILNAAWSAFDQAVRDARGRQLRKGPRGGGRELDEIVEHVTGAEMGYLRHLGCDRLVIPDKEIEQRVKIIRSEVLEGIEAATRGELPPTGPHGGKHWPLAYFFRRFAWHVIDHTWEIEDRVM